MLKMEKKLWDGICILSVLYKINEDTSKEIKNIFLVKCKEKIYWFLKIWMDTSEIEWQIRKIKELRGDGWWNEERLQLIRKREGFIESCTEKNRVFFVSSLQVLGPDVLRLPAAMMKITSHHLHWEIS